MSTELERIPAVFDEKTERDLAFIRMFPSTAAGVAALRCGVTTREHAEQLGLLRPDKTEK